MSREVMQQARRNYEAMIEDGNAMAIAQPVERKPLTDEIVRLASVALREMPRPCKTDWQEAAKRVCEAIADSLTCEECGGDGIVLASQNSWACSSCNISQKEAK